MKTKLIAPSILSADFSKLGQEVADLERGGADWIHVDVMDGHFVPNITMGPLVVHALKKATTLPLDCHLMVSDPEKWISEFAKAGASIITFHVEAIQNSLELIQKIKDLGCRAGVSIKPETPVSAINGLLEQIDLVLVMSVNPGFGGQSFMENSIPKIEMLSSIREKSNGKLKFLIEVDGGVDLKNIQALSTAGVDAFVAGSAVFREVDRGKIISELRKNAL